MEITKIKVSKQELERMIKVIKTTVRCYNPETKKPDKYHYSNDGKSGYIVQSFCITKYKDGKITMWYA